MPRVAILLLFFAACSRSKTEDAPAEAAAAPTPATVAEIESTYATGRTAGDARFANRTLLLTGYVTSVGDDQGRTIVRLGPDAPDAKRGYQDIPDPGLRCPLGGGGPSDPAQVTKATALKAGAKITIECKAGTATSGDSPTLYSCTLP